MNATLASSDCARRKNPLSGHGAVWSGGQKREGFPVGMGGAALEPDRARRRKTGGRAAFFDIGNAFSPGHA